jgi:ribosomal protein S21
MRTTNVKVEKNKEEPAVSLLKRFQRKVQESGVLPRVRSIRYNERDLSDLKVKRGKLKKLKLTDNYNKLKRLGVQIEKKKKR